MSICSKTKKNWPKLPFKIRLFYTVQAFSVNALTSSDAKSLNRPLLNLFDPKASLSTSAKPDNGVVSSDVTVDVDRKLWFRLYINTAAAADGRTPTPIIVYFHGGGFALMSANSLLFDDLCKRLAREVPALVVSVNYRRSPEHKYPSQYEDGFDVLKFIDNNPQLFQGFPADNGEKQYNLFVAGDSAGGNLAHHVTLKACTHQFTRLNLAGVIALQPFFGGEARTKSETRLDGAPLITMKLTDWMWKALLPEGCNRDHHAVNVFGPNSVIDTSGLGFPPVLVVIGGFDPLQDWQRRYVEGLKKRGKQVRKVEYPNAAHGFYVFGELAESSLLMAEIKSFVHSQLEQSIAKL